MAFLKAAVRTAAVSAPMPEAVNLDSALQPLMNGLGQRYNANYQSDYDAWLSSDPGLVHFAAPPLDNLFVGRRSEREMLCFIMKKVLSKSSAERRVVLFTGPSGVGKTAAVKHALRYMMNETSGLEGSPDVIIETLRGRAPFLEEDVVALALTRNTVGRAGAKPDAREHEALTLLTAALIDVPYIILLDDADLEGLKRALELLTASRKGCAIFITSQTLDEAQVTKELVAAGDNNGVPTFFAHEVKPFTSKESLLLMARACPPHTYGGLYNQLDELKLILGDGPDPMQHLGHLPLAVRTFAEWVSEQYLRFMRSQTHDRVQLMVARWLLVCECPCCYFAPRDAVLQVGEANAARLQQPFDREATAVKLKASIEDGTTAGLAIIRTWKDHVERTHDPPKGRERLRCCHTAIGLKMKHMEEALPFEYQHPCAQLLQLLALCPADNVPWSLFDGGADGEGSILSRSARVELHGFVKATANNGRRGRVMEIHQDGTISVVFGCDHNFLSSVKPGAEVKRFKEGNVRLVGPLGAHRELQALTRLASELEPGLELPATDMEPALHDPVELKKIAAYLKAVMPCVVQVDEVRRTFSMHEIVAGHIRQGLGCQTDRMRALLHARCGQYLDETLIDPRLHKVMREISCAAQEVTVTCRRLGLLEGEGWGTGMLLRIYEMTREVWGNESIVTTRCLTLTHALLTADLCHHWLMSNTIKQSIKELADVPSVREILDACVGPFSFVRCMRTYLGPDCNKLVNLNPNRLKCMSWRYRTLRGSVETDEKMLHQIADVLREADPAWVWDISTMQMEAMSVNAVRLIDRGASDRAMRMLEQALKLSVALLGEEHPQTSYLRMQMRRVLK